MADEMRLSEILGKGGRTWFQDADGTYHFFDPDAPGTAESAPTDAELVGRPDVAESVSRQLHGRVFGGPFVPPARR